jgi:hypothetical protein
MGLLSKSKYNTKNSAEGIHVLNALSYAPQPNSAFNADANTGHGFAIFMASVGTLRTSCSGAG